MSEPDVATANLAVGATSTIEPEEISEAAPAEPAVASQYWIRVHGYPSEADREIVAYNDFYDPRIGTLPGDPNENLVVGDVLIYYADGSGSIYAVATVVGPPDPPIRDDRGRLKWNVPIKREAIIRAVNKAPHAVGLEPPSGWSFLRVVRDFTYIRVPDTDGTYYVEQVKSRASSRE
ncbi:MAG: hypothetical protein QOF51_2582 [Chloroflexota bacterium]|jgi:hypothetical protein|nr:hypothetical protein [Chloroflexota bacterium]